MINSGAQRVLQRLQDAGFDAYIVGGAVRDLAMGLIPEDYDIATDATPYQVKSLFPHTIDTGIKHGTITVIDNKIGYEVTTFREEGAYRDMRHPDNVRYVKDVSKDLKRRDFTINAMAYNKNSGLIDNFWGQDDLKKRIIRCVGVPEDRFKEDALRMLRAVRFAACLDFKLDESVVKAIKKCSVLIKNVSSERILTELNKILLCDHPSKIGILEEVGLLKYIIPDLSKCFNTIQNNKYHIYNVGEHILTATDATPNDLLIRWASLLHDVGKPNCLSCDQNGVNHFYGHHRESVRIANDTLHKLRMDKDSIRDILVLIENHDVRIEPHPAPVKRMLARTGENLFLKLLLLKEADNRAKNLKFLDEKLDKIQAVYNIYQRVLAEGQPFHTSHLQINGRDLLKLGFKTGREVGDTLKLLLDEVVIDPKLNTRDYLVKRARSLKKR